MDLEGGVGVRRGASDQRQKGMFYDGFAEYSYLELSAAHLSVFVASIQGRTTMESVIRVAIKVLLRMSV
jgi:hypothetical protein